MSFNKIKKGYNRYQLVFPEGSGTIYETRSFPKAIRKSFKEYTRMGGDKNGIFIIADIDKGTEFKFQVNQMSGGANSYADRDTTHNNVVLNMSPEEARQFDLVPTYNPELNLDSNIDKDDVVIETGNSRIIIDTDKDNPKELDVIPLSSKSKPDPFGFEELSEDLGIKPDSDLETREDLENLESSVARLEKTVKDQQKKIMRIEVQGYGYGAKMEESSKLLRDSLARIERNEAMEELEHRHKSKDGCTIL